MNLLTIPLVYVLNIRSENDLVNIEKAYFLKNKFWCGHQEQLKTDNGYLYEINIGIECENGNTVDFVYHPESCYSLKFSKNGYILIDYFLITSINSVSKSSEDEKFLLRFSLIFTDKPVDNTRNLKNYKGTIKNCVTYKLIEKNPENKNFIYVRCDGTDICMEYIKERFEGLIWMKLLKFSKYIKKINEKKLIKELNKTKNNLNSKLNSTFDLYYFKDYSECLEKLKEFVEDLCYFKLLRDGVFDLFVTKIVIDKKTTLRVSQFKDLLKTIFFDNLKKLYDIKTDKTWEELFETCFKYIKDKILKNNICFPIEDKYDINFYINQLSILIYETIKKKKKNYAISNSKRKSYILSKIFKLLKNDLRILQKKVMKDLCESKYIHKHFSELLERNIETLDDYKEVEKIVCDYYNMFVLIFNLYYGFSGNVNALYFYCSPMFIDNYNLEIVDGITIKFNSLVNFGQIRGFDGKTEEIFMMKDTDYFVNENILHCPSEVLELKNIQEIEVTSFDKKNSKRFKINEYLRV